MFKTMHRLYNMINRSSLSFDWLITGVQVMYIAEQTRANYQYKLANSTLCSFMCLPFCEALYSKISLRPLLSFDEYSPACRQCL